MSSFGLKMPHRWYMQTCWSVSPVWRLYLSHFDFHRCHSWAVRFNSSLRALDRQAVSLGPVVLAPGVRVSGTGFQAIRGWCVLPCFALTCLILDVGGEVQTVLTRHGVDTVVDSG